MTRLNGDLLMMDWLKKALFGAAVGSFYAFVSFYLFSPGSDFYMPVIVSFGLQGMLFVVSYKTICIFFSRYKPLFKQGKNLPFHIMSGAISGLISGSISIFLTYNTHLLQQDRIVPYEIRKMVIKNLFQYSMGCILAGISIAYLVRYIYSCTAQEKRS